MGFMFLPTLSVLLIVFFWFFSWTSFVAFITSTSEGAGLLRVILLALEIGLVYFMYDIYTQEEIQKQLKENPFLSEDCESISYLTYVKDIFPKGANSSDVYFKTKTAREDTFLLTIKKTK
jgi:hypothetical protein